MARAPDPFDRPAGHVISGQAPVVSTVVTAPHTAPCGGGIDGIGVVGIDGDPVDGTEVGAFAAPLRVHRNRCCAEQQRDQQALGCIHDVSPGSLLFHHSQCTGIRHAGVALRALWWRAGTFVPNIASARRSPPEAGIFLLVLLQGDIDGFSES